MKVVAVTGSIGTGKSTFCKLLSDKYNMPIIDADVLARKAVEKDSQGLAKIKKTFGKKYITKEGELNRKKLGADIFGKEKKLKKLNSIVHPIVKQLFEDEIQIYKEKGEDYVLYDCPLLIEEELYEDMDCIILVCAVEDIQVARIMARDDISEEDARRRIASQMKLEDKAKYADIIVYNNGDRADMEKVLPTIYEEINENKKR